MTYMDQVQKRANELGRQYGGLMHVTSFGGSCPFQAEGSIYIDAVQYGYFYFRSRGGHWSFSLDKLDPIKWDKCDFRHVEKYSDDQFAAGWITEEEAWLFIERAIKVWLTQNKKNE